MSQPATRAFLSGVVAGPHWSIPLLAIVRRLPRGYELRQYPDVCHAVEAQYALPDWHWAWQFTHGREDLGWPYTIQGKCDIWGAKDVFLKQKSHGKT